MHIGFNVAPLILKAIIKTVISRATSSYIDDIDVYESMSVDEVKEKLESFRLTRKNIMSQKDGALVLGFEVWWEHYTIQK